MKNKIEDKLYRQNYSKQAVNMIMSQKRFSDVHSENIIGVSSPKYCMKATEAQAAMYDGNELLKPIHDPSV